MIGRPLCRRLLWYMVSVTAVVDLVHYCCQALFKQTPWVSNWNEQNLYYQQNEVFSCPCYLLFGISKKRINRTSLLRWNTPMPFVAVFFSPEMSLLLCERPRGRKKLLWRHSGMTVESCGSVKFWISQTSKTPQLPYKSQSDVRIWHHSDISSSGSLPTESKIFFQGIHLIQQPSLFSSLFI